MSGPGWVGPAGRRASRIRSASTVGIAAGAGLVGLSAWLVAYVLEPAGALRAWLAAWTYGLSVALGSLCLVMVGYVTGAKWIVVLRRLAEGTAMSLPVLALGALPVLIESALLYPWARPAATLPDELGRHLAELSGWLDPTFFSLRAVLYMGVWIALAAWLWRASLLGDAQAAVGRRPNRRPGAPVGVSAAGLILLGLTLTFAAFDWLMSLAPTWSSTVFGVYWFAGGMVAALSALVLLTRGLHASGALHDVVADAHYYALGRLLLAFVVFWAYIAYSQGFLVWIGNVPGDVEWYLARGGGTTLLVLAVVHFVLPFLVLLNYAVKRRPRPLSWIAMWLLVAHWVDTRWLVGPVRQPLDLLPGWMDLAALVAVVGLGSACGAWMLDGKAAVPQGDPHLQASIRYEAR